MDTEKDDHPIAEARANLSELLSAVRLLRRSYFLTSRNKRQAALVPVELGELIEQAGGPDKVAAIIANHLSGDLGGEHKRPPTVGKLAPTPAAPAPTPPPAAPRRRTAPPIPDRPRASQPERTRAEADAEVETLYNTARQRATPEKWAGLEQLVERIPEPDRKRALLGQAAGSLISYEELERTAFNDNLNPTANTTEEN
jgi:prevent-host-death family protein